MKCFFKIDKKQKKNNKKINRPLYSMRRKTSSLHQNLHSQVYITNYIYLISCRNKNSKRNYKTDESKNFKNCVV